MSQLVQGLLSDFSALEKAIVAKLLRTNTSIRSARKENTNSLVELKIIRREVDKLLSRTKVTKCNLVAAAPDKDETILSFKNLYIEIRESYMRFS